jgi:hypothetical protein
MSLYGSSQHFFATINVNKFGVPGNKVNLWLADIFGGGGGFVSEKPIS